MRSLVIPPNWILSQLLGLIAGHVVHLSKSQNKTCIGNVNMFLMSIMSLWTYLNWPHSHSNVDILWPFGQVVSQLCRCASHRSLCWPGVYMSVDFLISSIFQTVLHLVELPTRHGGQLHGAPNNQGSVGSRFIVTRLLANVSEKTKAQYKLKWKGLHLVSFFTWCIFQNKFVFNHLATIETA